MKKLLLVFGVLGVAFSQYSPVKTEDYNPQSPKLDIRQYLNGPLTASGILLDWKGAVQTHFHVTMRGTWQGNVGTLEENFIFSNGKTDKRVWTIKFNDDTTFTAKAGDSVGEATGSQSGNIALMNYVLAVKRDDGSTINLTLDDRLFLMDDKTLINHTRMKKFGVTVAQLIIQFQK
jgi:hypothetical protein